MTSFQQDQIARDASRASSAAQSAASAAWRALERQDQILAELQDAADRRREVEQLRQLLFAAAQGLDQAAPLVATDPANAYHWLCAHEALLTRDVPVEALPEFQDKAYHQRVAQAWAAARRDAEARLGAERAGAVRRIVGLEGALAALGRYAAWRDVAAMKGWMRSFEQRGRGIAGRLVTAVVGVPILAAILAGIVQLFSRPLGSIVMLLGLAMAALGVLHVLTQPGLVRRATVRLGAVGEALPPEFGDKDVDARARALREQLAAHAGAGLDAAALRGDPTALAAADGRLRAELAELAPPTLGRPSVLAAARMTPSFSTACERRPCRHRVRPALLATTAVVGRGRAGGGDHEATAPTGCSRRVTPRSTAAHSDMGRPRPTPVAAQPGIAVRRSASTRSNSAMTKVPSRTARLVPAALTVSVLAACGPGKLDRGSALEALAKSDAVAHAPPITQTYARDGALGTSCDDPAGQPAGQMRLFAPLQKAGLIAYAPEQRGVYAYCALSLTPAGERELGWQPTEQPRGPFAPSLRAYVVPLFAKVPDAVSGVAQAEGDASRAHVEFTWRMRPARTTTLLMADLTNGSARERADIDSMSKVSHAGTAEFRRYDDGWRVESVAFGR